MIILLDTSTPICKLTLLSGDQRFDDQWQADRGLARGLLGYIHRQLEAHQADWSDVTAIGVLEGPGSFTGLRIGLTVMNTLAGSQSVPIVGARGDSWQQDALRKINDGQNDRIVMPFYGSDPHITQPRK